MYDELKHKYAEEKSKLQEDIDVLVVRCSSLEDFRQKMERDAERAAMNLERASSQLVVEKQEKEHLSIKFTALKQQRQHDHTEWQANKCEMEGAITQLQEEVRSLQQMQSQVTVLRGRVADEKKKVGQLQRDLQASQEMLKNKDEEHKAHVKTLSP